MKWLSLLLVVCYSCQAQIPPFIEECVTGKYPPTDGNKIPRYVVDLDLPPQQRWHQLGKEKKDDMAHLVATFKDVLSAWSPTLAKTFFDVVDEKAKYLDATFPYPFNLEVKGLADATGLPLGEAVLYNIFYELFSMCTSIVAESSNGKLYHVRNLDFGLFMGWESKNHSWQVTDALRPLIVQIDFQRNGHTVFKSVSFAGYLGILTAVKPGAFSLTVNERYALNGGPLGILEWILGMRENKWMGFLTREVMENSTSYAAAKDSLVNTPMLSPCYFILGGNQSGEGAIITRARDKALDVWNLGERNSTWYLLETNYDNWKKPLFVDDRRDAGHTCMDKLTQKNVGFSGLYDILSSRPVLNKLTTYTALMQVNSGSLENYLRYCPDPCPPW